MTRDTSTSSDVKPKLVAVLFCFILLTQSVSLIIGVNINTNDKSQDELSRPNVIFENSFTVNTVHVAGSPDWISFDMNNDPGTPAEAHVTVSDTLGLRVVADFYGFWDENVTLNNTLLYDRPKVPGTSFIQEPGLPNSPVFS